MTKNCHGPKLFLIYYIIFQEIINNINISMDRYVAQA